MIEEMAGLEVVGEVSDGLELLNVVKCLRPDMVILDISMPNLRGIEAAHELRTIWPDVKVLMLTMHKDKELLHHAMSAGAEGYLLKEDSDTELLSAIEKIRRGGIYLSPILSEDLPDDWEQMCRRRKLPFGGLTTREREVLTLIAEGKSSRETADLLFISVRTVEHHRANIMDKLGVKKAADLIKYAIRKRYISASQ
jgi:DNA-binding NarL/FixJ family response regulator